MPGLFRHRDVFGLLVGIARTAASAYKGCDLVGDLLWRRRPVSDEAIEAIVDALVDASDNNVDELEDYAEYVLDGLRAAGFELYRPDDMAEEWWCLTHALPGDRDLNDLDAIRRRCFAHRINWDRPRWTQLKCRMVRRTVLVPVEG